MVIERKENEKRRESGISTDLVLNRTGLQGCCRVSRGYEFLPVEDSDALPLAALSVWVSFFTGTVLL